jgi:phage-related protein
MKENLEFFFNNELSTNLGIININLGGSLYEERLFGTRTIIEEAIRGRTKPYFQAMEQKPFQFDLAFAFLNDFDYAKIRQINRWLNVDYYKEFYFLNEPDYRLFVMPIGDSYLTHTGTNQGYIRLTMQTNDAYAYSQEILSEDYDLSSNPLDGTIVLLDNNGDIVLGVEMWIKKVGDGDIIIVNTSNEDKSFQVINLKDGEQVYINHDKEEISSNFPNFYHFDDVLSDYMKLPLGENVLKVYGTCTLQFRYRYKYLLGL